MNYRNLRNLRKTESGYLIAEVDKVFLGIFRITKTIFLTRHSLLWRFADSGEVIFNGHLKDLYTAYTVMKEDNAKDTKA